MLVASVDRRRREEIGDMVELLGRRTQRTIDVDAEFGAVTTRKQLEFILETESALSAADTVASRSAPSIGIVIWPFGVQQPGHALRPVQTPGLGHEALVQIGLYAFE